MKTLLILRHAKSDWSDSSLSDHDRPLNDRGKHDAPRMGELLRRQNLLPDLILSSTAKRARQTTRLLSEAAGYSGEIQWLESLYAAPPSAYLKACSGLPDSVQTVMVVGHNPGLEELLAGLTGELQSLPTAALAEVELPIESWQELRNPVRGRLLHLWKPKAL